MLHERALSFSPFSLDHSVNEKEFASRSLAHFSIEKKKKTKK